ncbi:MAG: AarF/UbiB family protein [Nanoarchaeota archaeon]
MDGLERFRDMRRFQQIVSAIAKHESPYLLYRLGLSKDKGRASSIMGDPKRLRLLFEELGGTFTKLAQLLSLRPDLIPKAYCDEFAKLQDHVPPFSKSDAERILEEELKAKAKLVTLKRMLASASIGQVYLAEIAGRPYAIKIMRPGIQQTMHADLEIIHFFAEQAKRRIKPADIDPMFIYEQFRLYTEEELDYRTEARHIETFYRNFLHTKILIPELNSHFSTRRVLTMSYIPGRDVLHAKLTRAQRRRAARDIADAVFKQIFIDGYFHADPHPGNILLSVKAAEVRVGLIDFGIVGQLDDQLKEQLTTLFIGLVTKDVDGTADAFIALCKPQGEISASGMRSEFADVLRPIYEDRLKTYNISRAMHTAFETARRHRLNIPKDLVLLVKSIVTLESVGAMLDPDFDLVASAKPFVSRLVKRNLHPSYFYKQAKNHSQELLSFLVKLPDTTNSFMTEAKALDERFRIISHDLEHMDEQIKKNSAMLSHAIVIAALLIAAAIAASVSVVYAWTVGAIAIILSLHMLMISRSEVKYG